MNQSAIKELNAQGVTELQTKAGSLITEHLDLCISAISSRNSTGRGSKKKIELYGIKKLRELILELAVRGKLVPQDPTEEPASELLKYIAQERAKLVEEVRIKRRRAYPDVGLENIPFGLPKSWSWVCLSDLGTVSSSSRVHKKDWQSEGVPFYRAREIVKLSHDGSVDNELYISEELYSSLSQRGMAPAKNDIMITGVGTIGVPYVVSENDKFYFKDASVLIFQNHFDLYPWYLNIFMRSPFWGESIHEGSMGTTVHTFTINRAKDVLVSLPPLKEQRRIVAKVDELMALCNQLENQTEQSLAAHAILSETLLDALTQAQSAEELAENWQRLEQNWDLLFPTSIAGERAIDKLKQTILQLAVMGKLVPQDPNDEPASELLKRIASEKKRQIDRKEAKDSGKLHAKSPREPAYSIPKTWCWVRFREVAWCFRGHNPPKTEFIYEPRDGYVRFIQITDFKTNERAVYVPINKKNKMVYRGEIILAAYRHIGKLSRDMEGAFNVALCKVLEFPPMSRDFLELLIGTDVVSGELLRASERGHIPSMHSDHLLSLLIPLPPLEEQNRIVDKKLELFELCDQLKQRLKVAGETQQKIADAVAAAALTEKA